MIVAGGYGTKSTPARFPSALFQGEILNRSNVLYLIIGALVVAVIVLGTYLYREEKKPDGVQMTIDQNGVSVKKN